MQAPDHWCWQQEKRQNDECTNQSIYEVKHRARDAVSVQGFVPEEADWLALEYEDEQSWYSPEA